ncbi:MAG: TetR/AcrR family transcriptional regulator [Actinomycetota bacterium]|nr:TetR/AcrR family transcriptional regulator [Actinomycetota bacterium]
MTDVKVPSETSLPTRERLIAAAIDLFAQQGFRETTVGDIEAAAGLVPRRGGLYNHFESKEALLVAAVERHVRQIDEIAVLMDGAAFEVDLRTELTFLARWVIAEHRHEEPLLAILQRDGERFPELRDLVGDKIVERGYRQGETWLRRKIAAGGFPDYDAEAVIVVALGSLVAYAAQEKMLGGPPLGVDEDRFVATWVEAWLRVASTAEEERAES